jgi:hypothetical protein
MMMRIRKYKARVMNGLIGATAVLYAGAPLVAGTEQSGPVLEAAVAFVTPKATASSANKPISNAAALADAAVEALEATVSRSSHPQALATAFRSYFAFKAAHPEQVTKPYLYYVDYGLSSREPRGYVFDMQAMQLVEGPFTVAHGRGSKENKDGVPVRFSNVNGSYATSLGLYLAEGTYSVRGKASGRAYSSIGLELEGQSGAFNDNALARRVVAHGAPYVTEDKAGRSEGCPAMEPQRAKRLLPKLANGGIVFLFAPDADWMSREPWTLAAGD